MNNLNSVLLEGNLTRDPDVMTLDGNVPMTRFSIGVNRSFINKMKELTTESSFFSIVTWGKTAELCAKHLQKGRGVRVLGRLKQERWKNDREESREKVVVVAEHVEFQNQPHQAQSKPAARPLPQQTVEISDPSYDVPEKKVIEMNFDATAEARQQNTTGSVSGIPAENPGPASAPVSQTPVPVPAPAPAPETPAASGQPDSPAQSA